MIDIKEYIKLSREERMEYLDLDEPCLERGGNSTVHKGVLAQYLDSTIPSGRILLCHACNNPVCSNPKHLYWGTDMDNIRDAKEVGTRKSTWECMVAKYGYEDACKIQKLNAKGNSGGGRRGKTNSVEHNQRILDTLLNKNLH